DREEAIHDAVPLFGIYLLREVHRALHIGEEDGHLLALTFQRASRREYLLGEVTWGVRQRCRGTRWQGLRRGTSPATQGGSAFVTERGACRICGATCGTWHGQGRCALVAKLRSRTILISARRAAHRVVRQVDNSSSSAFASLRPAVSNPSVNWA